METPLPVVICDDSQLARNQMSRALAHWNVDITFAEHGLQALEAVRQGKGHLLFLDLTMPIMDGYEVLERIVRDDLPCITIVVSGDIQASAQKKVLSLGAIGFIEKPINMNILNAALDEYGLLSELQPRSSQPTNSLSAQPVTLIEKMREVANIAMGRTANQLAQMLDTFIHLPVPRVDHLSVSELMMSLNAATGNERVTSISQGFVGSGITGEALLIFQDSSVQDLAKLLQYEGELNEVAEREVLMDIANVLTGAFFSNLSRLLQVTLSRNTPRIIGLHCEPPNLDNLNSGNAKYLCLEIDYQFGESNTHCDLLLLFTDDSLSRITQQLEGVA